MIASASAIKIQSTDDFVVKKGAISSDLKEMAQAVDEDQDAHASNIAHTSSDEMTAYTTLNQQASDAEFKKKQELEANKVKDELAEDPSEMVDIESSQKSIFGSNFWEDHSQ